MSYAAIDTTLDRAMELIREGYKVRIMIGNRQVLNVEEEMSDLMDPTGYLWQCRVSGDNNNDDETRFITVSCEARVSISGDGVREALEELCKEEEAAACTAISDAMRRWCS